MASTVNNRFYIKSQENGNIIKLEGSPTTTETPLFIDKTIGGETQTFTVTSTTEFSIQLEYGDIIELYSNIKSIYGLNISAAKKFIVGGNIMSLVESANFSSATTFESKTDRNFSELFINSQTLVSAQDLLLPATALTNGCYCDMFNGCTNLEYPPANLQATSLAENCYAGMFKNCSNLLQTPTCANISTLNNSSKRCFANMFEGCKKITAVMELNDFAFYTDSNAYEHIGEEMKEMYKGCILLTTPYTKLDHGYTIGCYESMYNGCTTLATTSTFDNTKSANAAENAVGTLKTRCCANMYASTSVSIPVFPDDAPANIEYYSKNESYAYRKSYEHFYQMYYNCKSITSVTLNDINGGNQMFKETFIECTNITTVNISFNIIDDYTAQNMFYHCTALTSITLSILAIKQETVTNDGKTQTIYAENCCNSMFSNCTGLRTINNTITFGENAYLTREFCNYMFSNCTSLNTVSITLPFFGDTTNPNGTDDKRGNGACRYMFQGCTSLNNINNISITGWLPDNALLGMFTNCTNLRYINSTVIPLYINGSDVCNAMFMGCTNLINVNKLQILGNLGKSCCKEMFKQCGNLTTAPVNYFQRDYYPEYCYQSMFEDCSNLTTLEDFNFETNNPPQFRYGCFSYMFKGCTKLNKDWKGIKGRFDNESCFHMFDSSGLKSFGKIIVTGVINEMHRTFAYMFNNCINLNVIKAGQAFLSDPALYISFIKLDEAGQDASFGDECFAGMFSGCTSLYYMPIIYTGTADANTEANNIKRSFRDFCFYQMFYGCNNVNNTYDTFKANSQLYTTHTIYANSFGSSCFAEMFNGCTSFGESVPFNIVAVSNSKNTSVLGSYACQLMFNNSGIKYVPRISANTIKAHALENAFTNCSRLTGITTNGGIYATNTEEYAMYQAFKDNKTLSEMPPLNITNYGPHACEQMFMNTKITTIGTSMMYARQVSEYSFCSMFEGCDALVSLSDAILPGGYINYQILGQSDLSDPNNIYEYPKYSYLLNSIRYNYFYGPKPGESGMSYHYIIADIIINGVAVTIPKVALSDYTFARMFYGCTALKTPPEKMNNIFYGKYSCYLMFANTGLLSTPELTSQKYTEAQEPKLEDENNWYVKVANGTAVPGNGKTAVTPTGKIIYKSQAEPIIEEVPEGAFCGMFMNTNISSLPSLYAKKFGKNAGNSMFRNCMQLEEITYIDFNISSGDAYAFSHMFNNCRNLRFASSLGQDETNIFTNLRELKSYACCGMFANCTNLSKIIKFNNLSSIADGTFASMYLNCRNLTGTIKYDFSNLTVGNSSFANMFRSCVGLSGCEIKLGTMQRSCCENMFLSCEGLTTAKIEFRDQVASSYALSHMFYGCSNLMDVWCNMRIGFTFDLTHEWLLGVAEGGTYHHSSLINSNLIVHDTSSVPEGWTCVVGYEMGGDESNS